MPKFTIVGVALAKQLGVDDLFTLINERTGHGAVAIYLVIVVIAFVEHRGLDELRALIGERINQDEKKS